MNKYQARCRLSAGDKVTHDHFTNEEFLFEQCGRVLTEDGYPMPNTAYNPWSCDAAPEGWRIYKPLNQEE
jgi:hypothetical protein